MIKELSLTEEYPYKMRTFTNLVPAEWWINLINYVEDIYITTDEDDGNEYLNNLLKSEYNATWVGMGCVRFKSEADAAWFLLRFS